MFKLKEVSKHLKKKPLENYCLNYSFLALHSPFIIFDFDLIEHSQLTKLMVIF